MKIVKNIIIALICLVLIPAVFADVSRVLPTYSDGTNNYVCEDSYYELQVTNAGNQATIEETIANGWTFSSLGAGAAAQSCAIQSGNTQVKCSVAGPFPKYLRLNVANSVGAAQANTFSGQYLDTSHSTWTTIPGSTSIMVKANACVPDQDSDRYWPTGVTPSNRCTCLGGADCDDVSTDDPGTTAWVPPAPSIFPTNYAPAKYFASGINPGISEGVPMCEDGIDQNCDSLDTPCPSSMTRTISGPTYEVGLDFTTDLDMHGGLTESPLVIDETFDANRFVCSTPPLGTLPTKSGICTSPPSGTGHVRWVISKPSNVAVPQKVSYTLTPRLVQPQPKSASTFSGWYYFGGRPVTQMTDDTMNCIAQETQCTIGTATVPCCGDGFDNDCDGLIDCADSDCVGQSSLGGLVCCQVASDCTGLFTTGDCGTLTCDTNSHCNIIVGVCANTDYYCDNADYTCKNPCDGDCGLLYSECLVSTLVANPSNDCTQGACMQVCDGATGGSLDIGGYLCI